MKALNLQNRTFAIIENGSWAVKSGDLMQKFVNNELKNMTVLNERLSLASSTVSYTHLQVAIKLSGLPENRVIGSGTVLDSARLRYKLGEHLSVDSRSVHAFIVGEHGDSEVVAWSSANVSGVPLSEMCEMRGHYKHKENTAEIATAVKNSAYEIINKKHATYYGIAMSVKRICEVIMRDEKSILPVSHMIHGVYDIDGVSLSMPCLLYTSSMLAASVSMLVAAKMHTISVAVCIPFFLYCLLPFIGRALSGLSLIHI